MQRKAPDKKVSKKKPTRKRVARKKKLFSLKKLSAFIVLMAFLLFTVSVVGYVIFFRTVITQDIQKHYHNDILVAQINFKGCEANT